MQSIVAQYVNWACLAFADASMAKKDKQML